jgi:hypothetical protein
MLQANYKLASEIEGGRDQESEEGKHGRSGGSSLLSF